MWRTVAPITVLVAVLVLLLVPFHPEAVVLNAVVDASTRMPLAWRIDWFVVETGGNFAMFAVLGAAARLLLRRAVRAFVAACAVSAVGELAQLVIPHRVASLSDFVTNALGALAGVLVASAIVNRFQRSADRDCAAEAH